MNSKPKVSPSPKELIPFPVDNIEPPSENEVIQNEFVEALMAGNAVTAATALRKLDALHKPVPELLADLFDGDPELAAFFPYRLKLVPRRRGRPPVDYLTKQAKEQVIARLVVQALPEFIKVGAAVHHVEHVLAQMGMKTSRSAILKCFKAHRDKFLNKQSP